MRFYLTGKTSRRRVGEKSSLSSGILLDEKSEQNDRVAHREQDVVRPAVAGGTVWNRKTISEDMAS